LEILHFCPLSAQFRAKTAENIFFALEWAKSGQKCNILKICILAIFCHPGLVRASHSQKTGSLGPKLEEVIGKTILFNKA